MTEHMHNLNTDSVEGSNEQLPNNVSCTEAKKALLLQSMDTHRELSKLLITTSMGAIPLYGALLSYVVVDSTKKQWLQNVQTAGPPVIFFILATLAFVICFFSKHTPCEVLNYESEKDIKTGISKLFTRRQWEFTIGGGLMWIGVIWGLVVIAQASANSQQAPTAKLIDDLQKQINVQREEFTTIQRYNEQKLKSLQNKVTTLSNKIK